MLLVLSNSGALQMKPLAVASLLLCSSFAAAEVQVYATYEHYVIAPTEVDQIKFELRRLSPVARRDQVFHGSTQWTLVPNFRWYQQGNLCRIGDVSVELNGVYTLPKLDETIEANEATRERFDAYYAALMEHEKGHQDLWVEAGEEIEHLLNTFEPFYNCQQMARSAKKRVGDVISRYQMKNRQYDKQTGHGRTQGAVIR